MSLGGHPPAALNPPHTVGSGGVATKRAAARKISTKKESADTHCVDRDSKGKSGAKISRPIVSPPMSIGLPTSTPAGAGPTFFPESPADNDGELIRLQPTSVAAAGGKRGSVSGSSGANLTNIRSNGIASMFVIEGGGESKGFLSAGDLMDPSGDGKKKKSGGGGGLRGGGMGTTISMKRPLKVDATRSIQEGVDQRNREDNRIDSSGGGGSGKGRRGSDGRRRLHPKLPGWSGLVRDEINLEDIDDICTVTFDTGQDVDYIFCEISALENDVPNSVVQWAGVSEGDGGGYDASDTLSVVSINQDTAMGATAWIKSILGSVAPSLHKNERDGQDQIQSDAGRSGVEMAIRRAGALDAPTQEAREIGQYTVEPPPQSPSHERVEPLFIDEDGFIISGMLQRTPLSITDEFFQSGDNYCGSGVVNTALRVTTAPKQNTTINTSGLLCDVRDNSSVTSDKCQQSGSQNDNLHLEAQSRTGNRRESFQNDVNKDSEVAEKIVYGRSEDRVWLYSRDTGTNNRCPFNEISERSISDDSASGNVVTEGKASDVVYGDGRNNDNNLAQNVCNSNHPWVSRTPIVQDSRKELHINALETEMKSQINNCRSFNEVSEISTPINSNSDDVVTEREVSDVVRGAGGKNDNEISLNLRNANHPWATRTYKDKEISKELRINAIETATKRRIAMLRKIVFSQASEKYSATSPKAAPHNKLNFVEDGTMKQISRLSTHRNLDGIE